MKTVCGVDVALDMLDARIGLAGIHRRFPRTPQGIAELAEFCRRAGVDLVVFEATGGYEKLPFSLLWAEGIRCALVNPRAVRDFAKALGYREKTDRIDAGVIARFAEVAAVEARPPAEAGQARLRALVDRLRQLVAFDVAQRNQARLVEEVTVVNSIATVRACLLAQIRHIEGEIASAIDDDPLWNRLSTVFRSLKGVADRTVATLCALLPEIGTLDNKAIAKLVGLAPLADDSGRRSGPRPIRGGRREVRDILFLVAAGVARWNQEFHEFHQRLIAAGKKKKVIRVALARKLLVQLNAKARDARREFEAAT